MTITSTLLYIAVAQIHVSVSQQYLQVKHPGHKYCQLDSPCAQSQERDKGSFTSKKYLMQC